MKEIKDFISDRVSKDIAIIVAFLLAVTAGFLGFKYYLLLRENSVLKMSNDSLNNSLQALTINYSKLRDEKNGLSTSLQDQTQKVTALANEVGGISGTVSTLTKLSQTDPELLEKYSKVYFLNENYVPKSLTPIAPEFTFEKSRTYMALTDIMPHLQGMLLSASSSNINLLVVSAYRSFNDQSSLKSTYKVTYGAGTANSFSADQGYSEHQLGTAFDLTTKKVGGSFTGFEKTDAYTWLVANAYKYGFILSYPPHNSYYVYEPWHWRYVGIALATYLHDQNKNFYDLDQRTIDQYLVNFFD